MRSASRARHSPTFRFRSSLSRTHGPAIRKNFAAGNNSATLLCRFERSSLASALRARSGLGSRGNETGKQWVRTCRPGLELRVKLTAYVPWVRLQLHDLDK